MKSEAHILLEIHLKELGLKFEPEFKFHPTRKWRFDYVIGKHPEFAVEIEGGIWTNGAHVRGKHYESDLEKYREGTVIGWKILRFSSQEVLNGKAREFIKEHCL